MSKEIKITVRYVEPTKRDKERHKYYMDKFWNGIFDTLNDEYMKDPAAFDKKYRALGFKP